MTSVSAYFEKLAEKYLNHCIDSCHFSDASVFATKVPRQMNFPCMGIDIEGFAISGLPGAQFITQQYNVYILDHVRDTGAFEELQKAFSASYLTAMKIIKDIRHDDSVPARYFDFESVVGTRIEFRDAALFGYAIGITFQIPFDLFVCKL